MSGWIGLSYIEKTSKFMVPQKSKLQERQINLAVNKL